MKSKYHHANTSGNRCCWWFGWGNVGVAVAVAVGGGGSGGGGGGRWPVVGATW